MNELDTQRPPMELVELHQRILAISRLRREFVGRFGCSSRTNRRRVFPLGYNDAPLNWWKTFVGAIPACTAKLAIVRADGSAHVAPVWVDIDGDDIVFMTSADTINGKAILREKR
jgi:hypothetical protein